jgi:tRNA-specific 2-thiouridylase
MHAMNPFSDSTFHDHATAPRGRDRLPEDGWTGAAGGSVCGDFITFGLTVEDGKIASAGFTVEGCTATVAAGSALVEMLTDLPVLDAARIGRDEISAELDGLSPERIHAAVLAEEALHRALGDMASYAPGVLVDADPNRKLVAMSGGVDSAVAAQVLADDGAEIVGVTMQLWDDPATDGTASCCSPQAVTAARRLAHGMRMPHFTMDLRNAFRRGVVDPYLAAFGEGLTPNPCVGCNGHVRFDALDEVRERLGAATLATGHYARIEHDEHGALLAAAADDNKDQTYMLAALDPKLIERLEFPLGLIKKPEVRERARHAGLSVADKAESQDLCFLAGIGRDDFLQRHSGRGDRPGSIVDRDGHEVGRHRGAFRFTVGQRRGLGVAAPKPLYVLDVDPSSNEVMVGPREALDTTSVRLIGARLLRDGDQVDRVKLRYRNTPHSCSVDGDLKAGRHKEISVTLDTPVDGAAPGQIACLMRGDAVVGWATIARSRAVPNDAVSGNARISAASAAAAAF